jgi:hypothetical protein
MLGATDTTSRDLLALLDDLDERPALRASVAALVHRLGTVPRQRLADGRAYVELSIGYVARAASTSYGTSWTAWHATLGVLGWSTLSPPEVEGLGGTLRVLERGKRWGQHIALHEECLRSVEQVARDVVARGLVEDRRSAALPPGAERVVEVVRGGRAARCPWHGDRRPSMIVNLHDGGASGLAVCMVCASSDGRRLSAHVRLERDGSWSGRLSASTLRWWSGEDEEVDEPRAPRAARTPSVLRAEQSTPWPDALAGDGPPGSVGEVERIVSTEGRSLPATLPGGSGEIVLGRLDGSGMRGSAARGDLLDVLRRAEARSSSDRETTRAWTASATLSGHERFEARDYLPDRLLSVSRMEVASTRTIVRNGVEVSLPDRWRPVEQEWVLFDLDRLSSGIGSRSQRETTEFLDGVRSIARQDGWLAGDHAVVETGPNGVQVWMRLAKACDPGALTRSWVVRAWLRGLARRLSDLARSAGCGDVVVDESAWGLHRYGRRPGWRLLRDGSPYRSRLLSSERGAAAG